MTKVMAEVFGFDINLVIPSSCEKFTDYTMVKNIGLNFDKMNRLGFIPRFYRENLKRLFAKTGNKKDTD